MQINFNHEEIKQAISNIHGYCKAGGKLPPKFNFAMSERQVKIQTALKWVGLVIAATILLIGGYYIGK